MNIDYAVDCAREYAKMFSTNAFAIHHLSTSLEVDYQEAKELFYHHIIEESTSEH